MMTAEQALLWCLSHPDTAYVLRRGDVGHMVIVSYVTRWPLEHRSPASYFITQNAEGTFLSFTGEHFIETLSKVLKEYDHENPQGDQGDR